MSEVLVKDHMTSTPHSINGRSTIEDAEHMMKNLNVRHLPVLEGGKLLGIISDRDLNFFVSTKADKATILEEIMSEQLYAVTEETPLKTVTSQMIEQKFSSALITNDGKVTGIFTTHDALISLTNLL